MLSRCGRWIRGLMLAEKKMRAKIVVLGASTVFSKSDRLLETQCRPSLRVRNAPPNDPPGRDETRCTRHESHALSGIASTPCNGWPNYENIRHEAPAHHLRR